MAHITIPAGLPFEALKLARDPQTGSVSFDTRVVEQIEQASGLAAGFFMGRDEDAIAALIVHWYAAHREAGGQADPVAEDLIAEARLEGERGVTVSHAPGRA